MRQTSINCYNQIKREGLLSERRLQVLYIMVSLSPCSAGELEKEFNLIHGIKGGWKQLSVLRDQGVLREIGTKTCSITGRNVIEWDMTGNLPIEPIKVRKYPSNIEQSIDFILKGMDHRGWGVISKESLINIRDHAKRKKKT
jgi:hypothetical protein